MGWIIIIALLLFFFLRPLFYIALIGIAIWLIVKYVNYLQPNKSTRDLYDEDVERSLKEFEKAEERLREERNLDYSAAENMDIICIADEADYYDTD